MKMYRALLLFVLNISTIIMVAQDLGNNIKSKTSNQNIKVGYFVLTNSGEILNFNLFSFIQNDKTGSVSISYDLHDRIEMIGSERISYDFTWSNRSNRFKIHFI